MIYFVLTKSPWFYCYWRICYFDGGYQIAKSRRRTCIFLLRVAINKALLVSTQSFVSFVYKIKDIEAEKYHQIPKIVQALEKKVGTMCLGAASIDHHCSKRLFLQNKGQVTAKTVG